MALPGCCFEVVVPAKISLFSLVVKMIFSSDSRLSAADLSPGVNMLHGGDGAQVEERLARKLQEINAGGGQLYAEALQQQGQQV